MNTRCCDYDNSFPWKVSSLSSCYLGRRRKRRGKEGRRGERKEREGYKIKMGSKGTRVKEIVTNKVKETRDLQTQRNIKVEGETGKGRE